MKDSRDIYLMTKYSDANINGSVFGNFKAFDLLNTIASTYTQGMFNAIDLVDFNTLKVQVDEFIEFCIILKEFRRLNVLFEGRLHLNQPHLLKQGTKIAVDDSHFEIDGHVFYTLNDVNKAWNNRAFL